MRDKFLYKWRGGWDVSHEYDEMPLESMKLQKFNKLFYDS